MEVDPQVPNSVGVSKDRIKDLHWEVIEGCPVGGLILGGMKSVGYWQLDIKDDSLARTCT